MSTTESGMESSCCDLSDGLRPADASARRVQERQKWDDYYASLSVHDIDDSTRRFGEELAARLEELLPEGGSVLESGCGAGWQSLILAEAGKLRVTLMDFAPKALQFAEQLFAHRGLSARFVCQDVFQPGEPEYDMVFNAGVLEHYTFDEQVAFLRGMASRSRKFVLALVPNRHCYWYWIWRIFHTGHGQWPYGKEVPCSDLSAAFEAAGLRFLGHWFGGGGMERRLHRATARSERGTARAPASHSPLGHHSRTRSRISGGGARVQGRRDRRANVLVHRRTAAKTTTAIK